MAFFPNDPNSPSVFTSTLVRLEAGERDADAPVDFEGPVAIRGIRACGAATVNEMIREMSWLVCRLEVPRRRQSCLERKY